MQKRQKSTVGPSRFRRFGRFGGVAVAAVMVLAVATPVAAHDRDDRDREPRARGLRVLESDRSFEDTWSTLVNALEANPNIRVIGQIDHAAAAAQVGLDLDPNRVVFFGNPALGSPVMAASRTAGLDLPQKMQVFESDGEVYVAYNPVKYLAARHQTGDVPTLDTIAGALANFAAIATDEDDSDDDERIRGLRKIERKPGIQTTASADDIDTTWDRLLAAIEGSPASVAFTVDHAANSRGTLAPTRLVVLGNPNLGTPLMQSSPTAGVDLPLKILVWEDEDGITQISTTSVRFLKKRHRLRGVSQALTTIEGAIGNFVTVAAG